MPPCRLLVAETTEKHVKKQPKKRRALTLSERELAFSIVCTAVPRGEFLPYHQIKGWRTYLCKLAPFQGRRHLEAKLGLLGLLRVAQRGVLSVLRCGGCDVAVLLAANRRRQVTHLRYGPIHLASRC